MIRPAEEVKTVTTVALGNSIAQSSAGLADLVEEQMSNFLSW